MLCCWWRVEVVACPPGSCLERENGCCCYCCEMIFKMFNEIVFVVADDQLPRSLSVLISVSSRSLVPEGASCLLLLRLN